MGLHSGRGLLSEGYLRLRFEGPKFSFQIALYLLVKQKENLALHQVSLTASFRVPLQLLSDTKETKSNDFYLRIEIQEENKNLPEVFNSVESIPILVIRNQTRLIS